MLGLPRLAGRRAFFVAGQRHHTWNPARC